MIKSLKGMNDITTSESGKWQFLEQMIHSVCRKFGFRELRTPVLERLELFKRGVGDTTDVVQKEMYDFTDKKGRAVALRPEGTSSVVRSCIQHKVFENSFINKIYYNVPCFRYERPQSGRQRQFYQFGAEFFGSYSAAADAELISLAVCFLSELGICDLTVNINSVGCEKCKSGYNAALREFFSEKQMCELCSSRLVRNPMRLLDCKNPNCKEICRDAPVILDLLCDDCAAHFSDLKLQLETMGIAYCIDTGIVRGLDYYTNTVFEIKSSRLGAQSTLCGGGRYNNLVKSLGGLDVPGIGFGMGIERLLIILENYGIDIDINQNPLLFVATVGKEATLFASKFVLQLRQRGIFAEKDSSGKSLNAQMKYANKINSEFVIVLGENELKSSNAKLKDMSSGLEREIPLEINALSESILNAQGDGLTAVYNKNNSTEGV